MDSITEKLASCHQVTLLQVDISKAFDTIAHRHITDKLLQLKLHCDVYNWCCNFLTDRYHATKWSGVTSNQRHINCGVIQGSVLGPTLFIIAISNLAPVNNMVNCIKYADDTMFVFPGINQNMIAEEWSNVNNWVNCANLKLNQQKTKITCISLNRHKEPKIIAPKIIMLDATKHKVDNKFCTLGVAITSNLAITPHISSIVAKSNKMFYALKILKNHGMDDDCLNMVFTATVLSRIQYAVNSWRLLMTNDEVQ